MLTGEAWRLKKEQWRACRPVSTDSHHFDPDPWKSNPNPDPRQSEHRDPDLHQGYADPQHLCCVHCNFVK
jgi:hypothetical protein